MAWRKVDQRLWADAKFLRLSDSGKLLWLYLLTGEHHLGLPGLFRASKDTIADRIGWSRRRFDPAWSELEAAEMLCFDPEFRVIFLPNATRYDLPMNPSHAKRWVGLVEAIPECDFRAQWVDSLLNSLSSDPKRSTLSDRFRHCVRHSVRQGVRHSPLYVSDSERDRETERQRDGDAVAASANGSTRPVEGELELREWARLRSCRLPLDL